MPVITVALPPFPLKERPCHPTRSGNEDGLRADAAMCHGSARVEEVDGVSNLQHAMLQLQLTHAHGGRAGLIAWVAH